MRLNFRKKDRLNGQKRWDQGFTLIEIIVVLALMPIIVLAVYISHGNQSETFSTQQSVARLQQDLRGALYLMQTDLFNAGRDPNQTMNYRITDIAHYDIAGNPMLAGPMPNNRPILFPAQQLFNSFPVLEFSTLGFDTDGDGIGDQPMTIRYEVFDFNNDGRLDLGRRVDTTGPDGNGFGPVALVAEGLIAVGYVFAYDQDPDGHYKLTRTPAGCNPAQIAPPCSVVWAVDSDGDGDMDTNVDIDGDGQITENDDTSGDGVIGNGDGAAWQLPPPPAGEALGLRHIRAVRISILLQSEREFGENVIDRNMYVVGNRVIPPRGAAAIGQPSDQPFADGFRRRVKTVTIALRNFHKI